jgi:hypothetical protein
MASILLLLPDEMLAAIDDSRHGPRLAWIRGAISEKLGTPDLGATETASTHRIPGAPERSLVVASPATPVHEPRMMIRQGTLPDGSLCAHPFRDDRNVCRICGLQR